MFNRIGLGIVLALGALSSQALVINSIDMEVRTFDFSTFVEPTTLAEAQGAFNAATFECSASLNSFDNVGSSQSCGGPNRDIATLFTLDLYSDTPVQWQLGSDYGLASVIYAGDGSSLPLDSSDLWWAHNWNNGDVWGFATNGVGSITLNILGFEHCCGGGMSLRFNDGDGWETASVPEPGSLALLALGLFGLGVSRRKR